MKPRPFPSIVSKLQAHIVAENFFVFVLSFWGTILAVRIGIYEIVKKYQAYPGIFLGNAHIHHFVFGLLAILGAGALWKQKNMSRFIALVLFGIGAGLFADETWLVITRQFWPEDYWGVDTLAVLLLIGALPLAFVGLLSKNDSAETPDRRKLRFHRNPKQPAISVVIPALNEEKFLARSLRSFLDQTYQKFEIIVVDNGSADQTAKIAKHYGAKVISEPQKGVGLARDAGFRQARGEIIATTDADTIVPDNWVEKIVNAFENQPNLVAFGGLYQLYSGPLLARFVIRYLSPLAWRMDKFFSGGWSLPAANLAVRKNVFLRAGGFKTSLKLGEDAELSQRLKNYGVVVLDPEFRVLTSGRRFRHGLLLGLATYAPNILSRYLWTNDKFNRLPAIRKEARPVSVGSLVSLLLVTAFLFSLFSWANPQFSQAKSVRAIDKTLATAHQKYRSAKIYTTHAALNFTRHHSWHLRRI